MIVKILKILLTAFVILATTACSTCKDTVYIDKPYEVKVPVKCVVPDANCTFDRETDTEVISSLLECIIEMKHNQKVCNSD